MPCDKAFGVGGDGTLNEAVQGFADYSKLLMGYIPAGSDNDYADNTGISQEPLEALEAVLSCQTPTPIDLGNMTYDDKTVIEMPHFLFVMSMLFRYKGGGFHLRELIISTNTLTPTLLRRFILSFPCHFGYSLMERFQLRVPPLQSIATNSF